MSEMQTMDQNRNPLKIDDTVKICIYFFIFEQQNSKCLLKKIISFKLGNHLFVCIKGEWGILLLMGLIVALMAPVKTDCEQR